MNNSSADQMMLAVYFFAVIFVIRMFIRQLIRIVNTMVKGCLIWFVLVIALLAFLYARFIQYLSPLHDAEAFMAAIA